MTWWTIPNALSLLRILLIPFIVVLFIDQKYGVALALLIFSSATDFADGLIARKFKQESKLGRYLDPAGDKLTMFSVYLTLGLTSVLPKWFVAIVIGRDLFIVSGVLLLYFKIGKRMKEEAGDFKVEASFLSKANTWLQLITAFFAFFVAWFFAGNQLNALPNALLRNILTGFIYLTALSTLITWLHYLYYGINKATEFKSHD